MPIPGSTQQARHSVPKFQGCQRFRLEKSENLHLIKRTERYPIVLKVKKAWLKRRIIASLRWSWSFQSRVFCVKFLKSRHCCSCFEWEKSHGRFRTLMHLAAWMDALKFHKDQSRRRSFRTGKKKENTLCTWLAPFSPELCKAAEEELLF